MKKHIFISVTILLILGVSGLMVYWESVLSSVIKTTLENKYQLRLQDEGLNFGVRAGRVSFEQPRIVDTAFSSLGSFIQASQLQVGLDFFKALRGKFEVDQIFANQLNVDLQHLPDGQLHLQNVVQRFARPSARTVAVAQNTSKPASANSVNKATPTIQATAPANTPSATATVPPAQPIEPQVERKEVKAPEFLLDDAHLNYTDNNNLHYQILAKRFRLNPPEDEIEVTNGVAYFESRPDQPLMTVENLFLKNLMLSFNLQVQVHASGVHIETRQTGSNSYDITNSVEAWRGVFIKVSQTIAPPREQGQSPAKTLENLNLTNLSVLILPQKGDENSPNAVYVTAESVQLKNLNEIVITNATVKEAGQQALQLKQLAFVGLQDGNAELESVQLQGVDIFVWENQEKSLNVNRAIEQIRGLIQDLFPPRNDKSAASVQPGSGLKKANMENVKVTWARSEETQILNLERLVYEQSARLATITGFSLRSDQTGGAFLRVPNLQAEYIKDLSLPAYDSMRIDNLQLRTHVESGKNDLSPILEDWQTLRRRIAFTGTTEQAEAEALKPRESSLHISHLQLHNARAEITHATANRSIQHVLNPLTVEWRNFVLGGETPVLGDVTVSAHIDAPAEGEIYMQGTASPDTDQVNLSLNTRFRTNDLTTYQAYYGTNRMITLEKSGLVIQGNNRIDDNFVNATFDLTLLQPSFKLAEGSLPFKIESKTFAAAMNGMRDEHGNIVLRGNTMQGNIKDPRFSFGTGIFEILTRNFFNRMGNIPDLAIDLAGSGANMVGNTIKAVGEGVGDVLKKVFGGDEKKP